MRRLIHNILFLVVFAAAVVLVNRLMRPHTPDFSVFESKETVLEHKEKTVENPPEKVNEEVPVKVAGEHTAEKVNAAPAENAAAGTDVKKAEAKAVEKKKVEKTAETVPAKPQEKKLKTTAEISKTVVEPEKTEKLPPEDKKIPEKTAVAEKLEEDEKDEDPEPLWIEDFEPDGHRDGVKYVDNWRREGGVLFTPKTKFYIRHDKTAMQNSVLVIESKKSSAVFASDMSGKIDLNETPVMRWRWRVHKLPVDGDGRHRKKDDQAVGIYIGAGTAFNQKSISYRWETETPIGHWGETVYSKVMKVHFLCLRNKESGLDVWHEESRNVRDDFMAKHGFVPKNFAIAICGNSQNSKSEALAEIDYIGFYSEEGSSE